MLPILLQEAAWGVSVNALPTNLKHPLSHPSNTAKKPLKAGQTPQEAGDLCGQLKNSQWVDGVFRCQGRPLTTVPRLLSLSDILTLLRCHFRDEKTGFQSTYSKRTQSQAGIQNKKQSLSGFASAGERRIRARENTDPSRVKAIREAFKDFML